MTKALITFGCSWTYGVGVNYDKSMQCNPETWKIDAWDESICNQLSFRGILSQRYGFKNINFSEGGSSNQRQFRLAKTFFNSKEFQYLQNNGTEIVVVWGITSTARNETYMYELNQVKNLMYSSADERWLRPSEQQICKFLAKNVYSHEHELFMLAHEMVHWNTFFKSLDIKNYWYDTFNHHDYTINSPALLEFKNEYIKCADINWPSWQEYVDKKSPIDGEVGNEILNTSKFEFAQFVNTLEITNFVINLPQDRDLMSQLVIRRGCDQFDRNYHHSHWDIDSDRVQFLIGQDLLNPFSKHPTKLGHEQIANMFDHLFEKTS
jgi:hypothetical protein